MNKKIFHSMFAVVIGFVLVAVVSITIDTIFELLRIFPGVAHPELYAPWMLVVALIYRSFATVLGGYSTARLAPTFPMRHVYVLAGLGLIGGIGGAIGGWSYGNHWYPVLLAITGPVFVWVGGFISEKR